MEKRTAKVIISAAGGTAAKGAKTCKVALPTAWLKEMGVSSAHREVELTFDGRQIIVSRRLSGEAFAVQKLAMRHAVRRLRFFDGEVLCTTIYADYTDQTLAADNHISNPVKLALGNNMMPTWDDLESFLEDRCVPCQRAGLREYLERIGVSEYDPLAIIMKTDGRMAEDNQWLEVEDMQ